MNTSASNSYIFILVITRTSESEWLWQAEFHSTFSTPSNSTIGVADASPTQVGYCGFVHGATTKRGCLMGNGFEVKGAATM